MILIPKIDRNVLPYPPPKKYGELLKSWLKKNPWVTIGDGVSFPLETKVLGTKLEIKDGTIINGPMVIKGSGNVSIGKYGGIAENLYIISSNHKMNYADVGGMFSHDLDVNKGPIYIGNNVWIGDNLAYDILSSTPKNAYLFAPGDTTLFNLWYVHYGLKVRPDIKLLSTAGNYSITDEQNKYLKKYPKSKDDPDIFIKTLLELLKTNKVYSTQQLQPSKSQKVVWIPHGLVYGLEKDKASFPTEEEFLKTQQDITKTFKNTNFNNQVLSANSFTISNISSIYSNALVSQGIFVNQYYKDSKLTLDLFEKARIMDKTNKRIYLALAYYYTDNKDCSKAIESAKSAIDIYPFDIISYYLLYYDYKFCALDNSKAGNVVKLYNATFKSDFLKDIKKQILDVSN